MSAAQPAGAAAGRSAGEQQAILDARGVFMKEQRKAESWERLQEHAESIGSFGSDDRQGLDRMTVNEWVAGLAPWDVYFTGTFAREGVSVASASKSFELFCRKFLRKAPVIYYVEDNPTRGDGGHHLHALCSTEGGVYRDWLWKRWFEKHGFARVLPVESVGGVAAYCAKLAPYVTKSSNKGGLWWNVLNGHRIQRKLAL